MATDHVEFPSNCEVDPEYPPAVLLQTNKTHPRVLDPLLIVTTELPSKTSGCDVLEFLQCVQDQLGYSRSNLPKICTFLKEPI